MVTPTRRWRRARPGSAAQSSRSVAIAALVNFAEWEEWVNLLVGLAVISSPYLFGFGNVAHAVTAHYVLGVLVVLSTGWELWEVHHPAPRMM